MTRTVKIPDASHPITIRPTSARVTVRVGGTVVAQTDSALSLAEASYPVVQYIPLADVDQSLLERTTTQSYCPYKGDASYYSVNSPDGSAETDLIWTYEHPYPSVAEIGGHVAFYPDRAEITVDPALPAPANTRDGQITVRNVRPGPASRRKSIRSARPGGSPGGR